MALAPGAKSRNLRPLPPILPATKWGELVTGQSLYPWQRKALEVCSKTNRPRVVYYQLPRKNGKTRLAAVLALSEACQKDRRHIYCVSDSERNLNSTLMREMRDIIGGSEHLRDSVHIFQHHIEVPETGSFIETRPNNFKASQGINPHLVLFDEVHLQKTDSIWSGMQMAGAAREDALLFGITTPGFDLTGLAHSLYTAVKAGDPTIYGRVFEGDPAVDLDDRREWRRANPCYSRKGFRAALEFDRNRLPEHEFRRFRLWQWTATESAWLPYGAWDALAVKREPEGRVWLGFDGSRSNDSTALVGCDETGHVFVVGAWENPGRTDWRVPRDDVEETVMRAFDELEVAELVGDPPYWEAELQRWGTQWPGRVGEFHTWSRQRMGPACGRFYAAVLEQLLSHDGDSRLARHVSNCVVVDSNWGPCITKADKNSPAKIDLAVAAVIAYERATQTRMVAAPPEVMVF